MSGDTAFEPPLLAGIDAGSSSVRALIFDARGRQVSAGAVPTPTVKPRPEWTDYDPEAIWQAAATALRQAVADAPPHLPIASVAVASVGESAVPIDAAGAPLHNAIAWYDNRTADVAASIERQLGRDRIFETTGLFVDSIFGLCKLCWLRDEDPGLLPRMHKLLPLGDWIAFRLSGVAATDPSLASRTLAYDIHRRDWSTALLSELDLPPDIYPPIRPSGTALGPVTEAAAAQTGLSPATIVAVGGHDHVCGAQALGVSGPDLMLDSMGTAEALYMSTATPLADPVVAERGYAQGAVEVDRPGNYVLGGLYSSGASLDWFRRSIAPGLDHETLIAGGEAVTPGSDGLIFVPHLHHAASPCPDSQARGAFVGLRPHMDRAYLYRAVLEGLAMETRLVADGMAAMIGAPREIRITGGNSRNGLLLKIKASVHRRPLSVMPVTEATVLGAALFGGLGAGVFPDLAAALGRLDVTPRYVEPDPEWMDRYDALFEIYGGAYAALRPLNHALGDVPGASA